jgi:hypothetical protein
MNSENSRFFPDSVEISLFEHDDMAENGHFPSCGRWLSTNLGKNQIVLDKTVQTAFSSVRPEAANPLPRSAKS